MALVYTAATDVTARLPGRTIGASSKPTTTQVEQWLAEAEGLLIGALYAGGITAPAAATTGGTMLKSWATDYAEAHTRMAWASTAGDENKDGSAALEKFEKLITDIYDHPQRYQPALNAGAASSATTYLRGANIDEDADDYVAAEFERDQEY